MKKYISNETVSRLVLTGATLAAIWHWWPLQAGAVATVAFIIIEAQVYLLWLRNQQIDRLIKRQVMPGEPLTFMLKLNAVFLYLEGTYKMGLYTTGAGTALEPLVHEMRDIISRVQGDNHASRSKV